MSSAICFNWDKSKILSSGTGLRDTSGEVCCYMKLQMESPGVILPDTFTTWSIDFFNHTLNIFMMIIMIFMENLITDIVRIHQIGIKMIDQKDT